MAGSLPDDVLRKQYELDLQIALGQSFMATQGWGSREVAAAYDRARELCAQLNRPPQLIPVLYGQWVNHLLRGELATLPPYRGGYDGPPPFNRRTASASS